MASTTVYPNGDGTISGWTTESSGTTNLYLSIDEGTDSPNDADYVQKSNTGVQTVRYWQLGDMPSDFGTATAVTLKIRCNRTSSKSDYVQITGCQLFQSDETTAITAFAGIADSTTITTYTLNPSITGGTSKTVWDGARIGVTVNSGSTGSSVRLYAAQVQVTYTATGSTATAAGDSTASGVGQSTDNSVATASGDSTATGVGQSTDNSVATASGDSTASGVGQSTDNSIATASGDSTASGQSGSQFGIAGDSTATGVGQSTDNSVATASGDSTATGVGQSTDNSIATASGDSTATGVGQSGNNSSVATASGDSTAVGQSGSQFGIAGDSTASGVGQSTDNSVATAIGDSTASGVGQSTDNSVATAIGDSTAASVGQSVDNSVATASGDSTAASQSGSQFSISGDSTASAVGVPATISDGTAAGTSTALANGLSKYKSTGTATGAATATGTATATRRVTGTSNGIATATGVGARIATATATASGTSTGNGTIFGTLGPSAGIASGTSWASCRKTQKFKLSSNGASKQACSATSDISKSTVLAMMPSVLDTTKAIILETGEIISLEAYTSREINTNIRNRTWVYYETKMPRRLFLTNPNWSVMSFDPRTRHVCIQMQTASGQRQFDIRADA